MTDTKAGRWVVKLGERYLVATEHLGRPPTRPNAKVFTSLEEARELARFASEWGARVVRLVPRKSDAARIIEALERGLARARTPRGVCFPYLRGARHGYAVALRDARDAIVKGKT